LIFFYIFFFFNDQRWDEVVEVLEEVDFTQQVIFMHHPVTCTRISTVDTVDRMEVDGDGMDVPERLQERLSSA
jgi:hypothetical protein